MVPFPHPRLHPLAAPLLLLLGCGAPAPTEPPTAPSSPNSSAATEPSPPGENSAAAAAPITPLPLAEALAIGDLSKLKLPADATRTELKPHSFSYSAPVTAERTLDATISDLQAQLAAAGWKPLAGVPPERNEHGATEYYEKQGVLLVVAIGKSQGYAPGTTELSGEDINATAMLIGNIDARTLPLPPEAKLESARPESQSYVTPLDPLAIRKFFTQNRLDRVQPSRHPRV